MSYVKVCRGGELYYCNNTNDEKELKKVSIGSYNALMLLNKKIIIDPDFTLQDYFELFVNYPVFNKLEDFLENFVDRYKDEKSQGFPSKHNVPDEDDEWIDLTCITVSKETHVNKTDPVNAESYIKVDGRGIYLQDDENGEYKKGGICESCGIELTDFITMLDCKIELEIPSIIVSENGHQYCRDVYTESVSEYDSGYTLFEFITSIIWELSFFGCPCNIDEHAQDLQDTVERIENGEEELIDVTNTDDLFNQFNMNDYVRKEYVKRLEWLKKQIETAVKDKKYWEHNPGVLLKISEYIKAKEDEIKEVEELINDMQ